MLQQNQALGAKVSLSWIEFKAFFQKSLKDSKSFVNTI